MRKKNLYIGALLTGCVLLAACGNSSTIDKTETPTITEAVAVTEAAEQDSTEEGDKEEADKEAASETVTGMVQKVEGSMITVAVMNMAGGNPQGGGQPQMPGGEAPNGGQPQMPEGEAPNGERPEMPNGEALSEGRSEMPNSGVPGEGQPEMPNDGVPGEGQPEMPNSGVPGEGQPEKPNGEAPGGGQSQMPGGGMMGGETTTVSINVTTDTVILDASGDAKTLEELSISSMVTVQKDAENNAISITVSDMFAMGGSGGNGQGAPDSYDALSHYTEDTEVSGETISSTGTDENAVLVSDGATVTLDQIVLDRTSADSTGGDASSFYGIGAAVLVTDGTVEVTDSTVETDAAGAAGVFAYGSGVAYVSECEITTTQDTSGGIHVAGGGTLHASNLTIETNGESAAAIRSDRGGGTMTVEGGSYTSNGSGSPAVYCTANISVEDAVLTATGSEAVCVEGLNTLVLTDCELTGNMPDLSQNDCTWTVILYQSMSGDSEIGNSTFAMNGGSLTSKNGGLFYTTNTESTFYLSDVDITYADDCEFFLKCTGNRNQRGWGQSGANGADCTFTANAQEMNGNILWDSISTLEFKMENESVLTGAFLQDESAAGNGGNGYANLSIDETSTWVVTADSTLSTLTCKGTIVDANQNPVTVQGTDGTVYVEGTSPYTVTVSAYNK